MGQRVRKHHKMMLSTSIAFVTAAFLSPTILMTFSMFFTFAGKIVDFNWIGCWLILFFLCILSSWTGVFESCSLSIRLLFSHCCLADGSKSFFVNALAIATAANVLFQEVRMLFCFCWLIGYWLLISFGNCVFFYPSFGESIRLLLSLLFDRCNMPILRRCMCHFCVWV